MAEQISIIDRLRRRLHLSFSTYDPDLDAVNPLHEAYRPPTLVPFRVEACAMCDALTAAETALGDAAPGVRQWWSPTFRERVRRVIDHAQKR